MVTKENVS